MLNAAPLGPVPPLAPLHHWLDRLLRQHPGHVAKVGPGLAGFEIQRGAWGRGRATWLVRVDGSRDWFSWLKCVGKVTEKQEIRQAYRGTVEDQVAPLRRPGCHVDHAEPWSFDAIVRAFEAEHGATSRADIIDVDNYVFGHVLPPDRASLFAEYHRARAVLVAIPAAENLRKPRSKP